MGAPGRAQRSEHLPPPVRHSLRVARADGSRWLTPAATNCYWRALIRAYASVQAFEPKKYGAVDAESFSLLSLVEWEPY